MTEDERTIGPPFIPSGQGEGVTPDGRNNLGFLV